MCCKNKYHLLVIIYPIDTQYFATLQRCPAKYFSDPRQKDFRYFFLKCDEITKQTDSSYRFIFMRGVIGKSLGLTRLH